MEHEPARTPVSAAIITVSDSRSSGANADETVALLARRLETAAATIASYEVVPDEQGAVSEAIRRGCDAGATLVLTTGGTGLGPRDVTPEATLAVIERLVPGIPELLRVEGARSTPMSWLSRGVAGQLGRSLVVNLPGSPHGADDGLSCLMPLLSHAAHVMSGGGHKADAERAKDRAHVD